MSLEMPDSMGECLYFSRRSLGETGQAVAWVKKIDCPECGKAKMGKPVVKDKVKIRANGMFALNAVILRRRKSMKINA